MATLTLDDQNGLKIAATNATTIPANMSITADYQLWAGTQVGETAWLDGGAAADSYPGSLLGFQAKNANTTDATGALKLLQIKLDLAHASASTIVVTKSTNAPAAFTKIVGIVGVTQGAGGTDCLVTLTNATTVTLTPQAASAGMFVTLLVA